MLKTEYEIEMTSQVKQIGPVILTNEYNCGISTTICHKGKHFFLSEKVRITFRLIDF